MLARQIAIGFGIAVIFPLLVFYDVSTFYPAPKFPANGTTECMLRAVTPDQRVECEQKSRAAREVYTAAAKEFSWRLLIVSTPLGVAAILIGAYLTFYAIGTGLILGGIFTVAFGYWGYWQYISKTGQGLCPCLWDSLSCFFWATEEWRASLQVPIRSWH